MNKPDDSYITVGRHATVFVGPDATRLVAATVLVGALHLYARAKILTTRGVTASDLLARATQITGKTYPRGGHAAAADDVQKWADTMRAALPIEREGKQT